MTRAIPVTAAVAGMMMASVPGAWAQESIAFSATAEITGLVLPWEGDLQDIETLLAPEALAPFLADGLEVTDATLTVRIYDLDTYPEYYVCLEDCIFALTEIGSVVADGVALGELTGGATDDWSETAFDLDAGVRALLAEDGELQVTTTLQAILDNVCGLHAENVETQRLELVLEGHFDPVRRPTAVPNAEIVARDGCAATVALNGMDSYDLDSTPGTHDDIVSFEWDVDGDGVTDAIGAEVHVDLEPGIHVVTLTVTDTRGFQDTATVTIEVTDPTVGYEAELTPRILWPPNHRYVGVAYRILVVTACTGEESEVVDADLVKLLSVESDEPDNAIGLGDGDTDHDVVIHPDGTVEVRAERDGNGNGRIYTFTFAVCDEAGEVIDEIVSHVFVPHNIVPRGPIVDL